MSLSSFTTDHREPVTARVRLNKGPEALKAYFKKAEAAEVEKLYWSISEMAKMLSVAPTLIRFWQEYFKIELRRNGRRERQFTKKDVALFTRIHYLVKVRLFTLEGARLELANQVGG